MIKKKLARDTYGVSKAPNMAPLMASMGTVMNPMKKIDFCTKSACSIRWSRYVDGSTEDLVAVIAAVIPMFSRTTRAPSSSMITVRRKRVI